MNHGFLISTGLTAITSGIAVWAIFKWHELKDKVENLLDRFNNDNETQRYLMHQYASKEYFPLLKNIIPDDCLNYQLRLTQLCQELSRKYNIPMNRVLDVGCATGGLSFHLSKIYKEVVGTDTSYPMLVVCQQMKQFAESTGMFSTEGGLKSIPFKARVPDAMQRDRVTFWDEDVCGLSHGAGIFSCVVVSQTLTFMSKPKLFLADIGDYVIEGGLLLISDSYNWSSGPEKDFDFDNTSTLQTLKVALSPKWTLIDETNLPYYVVRCERTVEVGNAHVTIWQRHPDEG